jgi:hypothetical protein
MERDDADVVKTLIWHYQAGERDREADWLGDTGFAPRGRLIWLISASASPRLPCLVNIVRRLILLAAKAA